MNERITVLYPITDLARDGAQHQLLELVRGLDKKRFRPVVLTLRSGGPMEKEFKETPGVHLISLERKGRYDLSCLWDILTIIRRLKADVIQPFLTPATFFALLPALLCGTPVRIVTERASAGRTNTRLGYGLYLKMEDMLSRFADYAIANSRAGEKFLIQRGIAPDRVKVIYNGVNLDRLMTRNEETSRIRLRMNVPPGGKVIGMMARMFPQKRYDIFLRAAAIISAGMPDTRFAVLGDGPLRPGLENLSNELGIGPKVTFFGEQREVGPYISAFDVAVLLSEAEGCSNSILEAMASGKPVVATDVGGNPELVSHGETGFLVPPGDVQAVAKAVFKLINDPTTANVMGQRGRDAVLARFSLNSMVRRYEAVYEETTVAGVRRKNERSGRA
jgi:glycosyltransferase involved in cell wall biosynthesis